MEDPTLQLAKKSLNTGESLNEEHSTRLLGLITLIEAYTPIDRAGTHLRLSLLADKSLISPDVERLKGQEPDEKARHGGSYIPLDVSQDKVSMVHINHSSGAELNPISRSGKTSDKEDAESGQNSASSDSEKELQQADRMEPKETNDDKESTTGSPNLGNRNGDGDPIIESEGMQLRNGGGQRGKANGPSAEASVPADKAGRSALSAIDELRNGTETRRVYSMMYREELWMAAYHRIKSKPGNMTPGSDDQTLDEISMKEIRKIIASLKDKSFQFRPLRRMFIPKANGKMRPLGIPCPMDKLVQEVMKIILEAIYEPTFKDCNHGFRPNRGCHMALQQISQ